MNMNLLQRLPRVAPRFLAAAGLVAGLLAGPAHAEIWSIYKNWDFAKPQFIHSLPFATEKVLLQVTQGEPERWNLVLSNAKNLLEYWGQSNIRIVVVAYGPGLKMLFKESPDAERIQSLDMEGVEFDACYNTMLGFKQSHGHLPALVPQAVVVPGGVVRVMQLEQNGFNFIKP